MKMPCRVLCIYHKDLAPDCDPNASLGTIALTAALATPVYFCELQFRKMKLSPAVAGVMTIKGQWLTSQGKSEPNSGFQKVYSSNSLTSFVPNRH